VLGLCSIAGVLCFRHPSILTTPELRIHYEAEPLRLIIACAIVSGVLLGIRGLFAGSRPRTAAVGIAGAITAILLGGPYVPMGPVGPAAATIGLDWLALDLLFGGAVFTALEWLLPRIRSEQPALRAGWRLDLAYFVVNHLLVGTLITASVWFAHGAFGWAVFPPAQEFLAALPAIPRFALVVLAADAVEYGVHRALHQVPILWRIHAIHHSIERMDWLAASRLHLLEVLALRSMILVPIFLMGMPMDTINAYVVFVSLHAVLIHANLKTDGGPLRGIIVTPWFHHWHHSSDAEALDTNYGAHTLLFDRLFGTAIDPRDRWPEKYGTVHPIPGGMAAQFTHPFLRESAKPDNDEDDVPPNGQIQSSP
jgi:sterol desaturase/sphingolipid hydroxylase (fatty acid hydroxylase superfamily)